MKRMRKPTPEFLLIDAGNTRLKWATTGTRGPVRVAGDMVTKNVTSAWITSLARKLPGHQVILASVVPKLVPTFRRAFSGRLVEVSASLPELGFHFHYPKPSEIGTDRLAAAVAIHARGCYPAIIVACGTATAFTVLDAKGRLCGGAIAPGLQTQLTALLGATAQLPKTSLEQPRRALGKSTQEAIRAGVMLNFQGGVKEIIRQLSNALPGRKKPHIILTGGNAHYLAGNLGLPFKLRPLLVLEGLHMIGLRTRTETL
jgi:type III pantothenate kinase